MGSAFGSNFAVAAAATLFKTFGVAVAYTSKATGLTTTVSVMPDFTAAIGVRYRDDGRTVMRTCAATVLSSQVPAPGRGDSFVLDGATFRVDDEPSSLEDSMHILTCVEITTPEKSAQSYRNNRAGG
ncbi:MAG: head-tail joining protein [Giesbergeria sp.]